MTDTFSANYKEKMYKRSLLAKRLRKPAKLELGQCLKKIKLTLFCVWVPIFPSPMVSLLQLRNLDQEGLKYIPLFAKSLRKFSPYASF